MLLEINCENFFKMTDAYKIERKTVWHTTEPENLLILIGKGSCLFYINNTEYTAKCGDVIIIPAGQEYLRRPLNDAPATLYYFHFKSPKAIYEVEKSSAINFLLTKKNEFEYSLIDPKSNTFNPTNIIYLENHISLGDEAIAIADKIISQIKSQHFESHFIISLLLTELLSLDMQKTIQELLNNPETESISQVPVKLKKAVLYINKNYMEPITLDSLCEFCNVSPQHLIRLFKNQLNMTPKHYINRFKIGKSRSIIRNNPDITVYELSHELGFDNPNYFSRLFTKISNETIADFKKRLSSTKNDISMITK